MLYEIQSYIAFPRSLEEKPNDQDLQSRHPYHHPYFNQTEIEDSVFRTPDRAEVPILSCTEVFLHAADRAELATDFENRVFQRRGLFRGCAGLLREQGGARFVFDL